MDNFAFLFTIILKKPISNHELYSINSIEIPGLKPVEILQPVPLFLSSGVMAQRGSAFLTVAQGEGWQLGVANLSYNPDIVRGAFQISKSETEPKEIGIAITRVVDVVNKLNLGKDLLFHEISINKTLEKRPINKNKLKGEKLKTLQNPIRFGLRIFEGEIDTKDIRSIPWKEVRIEPSIQNPQNSIVFFVYRRGSKINQDDLDNVLADIDLLVQKYTTKAERREGE
ncbi:MAG: hypothetical protein M1424_07405 [Candidatus Thermoplasmatota archaeon]|jgi:hypothetical protein|nr:hypothetical protein [Candidatus Thermoplasmatota archaeon]